MKNPSDDNKQRELLRQSIIGLGERSLRKSYYPELQKRIKQLEQTNEALLLEINDRKKAEDKQKKMESQLRQVQKMQAIGTLAGGIAHDFNNILAAIIGYTELAMLHTREAGISPISKVNTDFEGILKSSERAKDLVRRILSFSRQHEGIQKPLELRTLLLDTIGMLRAMIPTTITIKHDIKASESTILGDHTQLQQVIMNIGTNGYHSMEEKGGTLFFELDETYIRTGDSQFGSGHLPQGEYLVVCISDTGCGMDRKTMERIFDPYFTTKESQGGTGLGLSVVHGIITSHRGHISVYSEPGQGSTFQLYLPRIRPVHDLQTESHHPVPIAVGSERILVVDDEASLTEIMQSILESLGYTVTATTSPQMAVKIFNRQPDQFDLVITDMNMPEMNGAQLISRLRDCRGGIPIILCTGFSEMVNDTTVSAIGNAAYIMKPVIRTDLATAIRSLLDSSKP